MTITSGYVVFLNILSLINMKLLLTSKSLRLLSPAKKSNSDKDPDQHKSSDNKDYRHTTGNYQ